MKPADAALYRSLRRTIRALRKQPLLWDGIYSGVVRRTQQSQAFANLQTQATSVDLVTAFRSGGAAAITIPALAAIRTQTGLLQTAPIDESRTSTDTAFAALRHLGQLNDALLKLESDGAFEPPHRTAAVRYIIGQRLTHEVHGPCVAYGWDADGRACVEPATAADLARACGVTGIVDNRKHFVGIDAVDRSQPFYRIQCREGRGHYAAQELLHPVPLDEAFRIPIRGTSFFFTHADADSGCLVPRAALAQRYPADEEIRTRGRVDAPPPSTERKRGSVAEVKASDTTKSAP